MPPAGIVEAREIAKVVTTHEGELQILAPISLLVSAGGSLAITGPSGSGKSTLLGILAGLDQPSSGAAYLNGNCLTSMDEEQRAGVRAENVAFIFQSFQLLPGMTTLENVMLPLELRSNTQAKDLAIDFLSRVGLEKRLSHYPQQLSGGEQQRVAIARAFACRPRILFADEPTGNLDQVTGGRISELMFELNNTQGSTLLLITHEQRLASLCDRRISLSSGEVVTQQQELITDACV